MTIRRQTAALLVGMTLLMVVTALSSREPQPHDATEQPRATVVGEVFAPTSTVVVIPQSPGRTPGITATRAVLIRPASSPVIPTRERQLATETPETRGTPPPVEAPLPPTPLPQPTSAPVPTSPRLVIVSIGVNAPVVTRSTDSRNVMENPDDPFTVAWYDFTAAPGSGGNAVFAGHIDHVTVGRSVFWDLPRVTVGDTIEYRALDGTTVRYRVVRTLTLNATDPANTVVAPTSTETITLITCVGNFDRTSLSYDKRLVVQGERIST